MAVYFVLICRFLFMIEHVMPLCLAISWVYSVAMLVQNIVYEKEQRLKEVFILFSYSCFMYKKLIVYCLLLEQMNYN